MYKLSDSAPKQPVPPATPQANSLGPTPTSTVTAGPRAPVVTLADVEDVKEKYGQASGTFQWLPFRKDAVTPNITRRNTVPIASTISQRRFVECNSDVMCLRFTPDGKFIAAGLANGNIKLFNSETGDVGYTLRYDDAGVKKMPCTSISFPPSTDSSKPEHDHLLTATYACGMVKVWHYTSPVGAAPVQTINEERQTLVGTYNPHTCNFLTAGADPHINLYDMNTRQRIRTMKASISNVSVDGHRMRVFAIEYHKRQPNLFVSGGWDDVVFIWDDRQEHSIRKFYGPHICGEGLDIDPVHNHILTASWRKENSIQIWDFNSGKLIATVGRDFQHQDCVHYTAKWYGKQYILCGGCDNNIVRCIDRSTLNTVGELSDLPSAIYCLDFKDQQVAIGTGSQVWRVKNGKF